MRGRTLAAITAILVAMGSTSFAYLGPDPITPVNSIDTQPHAAAVADFNRDGHLDFALSGYFVEQLVGGPRGYIFLGDGSGNFPVALPFETSASHLSVAYVNGDSIPDLVGISSDGWLNIYIGDGAGHFAENVVAFAYPSPCWSREEGCGLAVADLDGDGNTDIALTGVGLAWIWRGDGTGNFELAYDLYPDTYSSSMPGWLAVAADFDLDGTHEIASVGPNPFVWLMQDPYQDPYSGGFLSDIPQGFRDLDSADFDGDGLPDLVGVKDGDYQGGIPATLSFMRGTGTGFEYEGDYPLGDCWVPGADVADFNRDSRVDVVASFPSGVVSLLFGDGAGSFAAPINLSVPSTIGSPIAGDFNEDGFPDVALISQGPWNENEQLPEDLGITLFLSVTNTPLGQHVSVSPVDPTTRGTPVTLRFTEVTQRGYTTVRTSSIGPEAPDGYLLGSPLTYYWLATEPLHDGPIEICVSYADISYPSESALKLLQGSDDLTWRDVTTSLDTASDVICGVVDGLGPAESPFVVAGQGPGIPALGLFGAPLVFPLPGNPTDLSTADFNGDGNLDIVAVNSDSSVYLFLGDGHGGLGEPVPHPAGTDVFQIVSADFDSDGSPDVAAISNNAVQLFLGNGDGTLGMPASVATSSSGNYWTVAGDFNNDHRVDLAVLNWQGFVVILLGDGAGGFSAPSHYMAGSYTNDLATADFNQDAKVDLAVAHQGVSSVYAGAREVLLLLGDGAGAFSAATSIPAEETYGCDAGDFNGDGTPDLVTAGGEQTVSVLLGNGVGGFSTSAVLRTADMWPWQVRAGDFNGDGHLDIASIDNSNITVRLGNGDGSFGSRGVYRIQSYANALRIADLNGDHAPDLILAGSPMIVGQDSGIWVLLNVSANTVVGPTPPDSPITPTDATTGTSPVEIYFSDVTASGFTGVSTSTTGPPPPLGFKLGNPPTYYEITTTATYSGMINICINYTGVSYPDESKLQIWHRLPAGGWEQLANVVRYPDEDKICAETASLSPFVVAYPEDVTPPTVSLVTPQDGASYLLNAAVVSVYSCDDPQSGVQVCSGTVASGAPLDTASVGPKNFAVTATDGAGNTATVTVSYRVLYRFTGFLSPVDNPPLVNVANGGRTIPVKWQLADAGGTSVSDLSSFVSLQSSMVGCDSSPSDTIPDSATTLDQESLRYDSEADEFHYNWRTEKGWTGTCRQIWLTLVDGTIHTATFKFK
ncbi:MAG: VCBS repeat-containing protein [Acidobacteria bacterium]|nr:VCBS repeat-containing protein [Acidobacteriota bacterium]